MTQFSIESFAAECLEVMDNAENRREAAAELLQRTIAECGPDEIIDALQAAVPPGASIGEMIVYQSEGLTMLFARLPPRFESGIHDHTVCACIGQLVGEEVNTIYETTDDGLKVAREVTARPGEVLQLPKDVIHHIANPTDQMAYALHLYAGDFSAIQDRRSLWDTDNHERLPFSFPTLVAQSVKTMKRSGNRAGLEAVAEAIPAVRPMIDG
jgi:predicted metal-dependent enzyme (double-stranded beta helix superfamily)